MRSIQDHLIALVAAAGVLLTSTNLQHQRAADVVEQTRHQALHAGLAGFVAVVEQDVRSIGSGVPTGAPMLLALEPDRFAFVGTSDSSVAARTIVYERTAEADGPDGQPRFRITRRVNNVVHGQSPVLTDFDVALFDAAGASVGAGALPTARRVRVRAELAPALAETAPAADVAMVRRVAWERDLAPPNLARQRTSSPEHPLLDLHVALDTFGDEDDSPLF